MENKKYELVKEDFIIIEERKLYRIRALRDFTSIEVGDFGGYIESEKNLSHDGNAWVYDTAKVYDNARVYGDAKVYHNAKVYGNAKVFDNTWIAGNARVYGDTMVYNNAWICGNARISDDDDYVIIKGFGSENRASTFFRCIDELIRVRCGCFYDTLEEFKNKVIETHGDNKYGKEYLAMIELVKIKFGIEE